MRSGLKQGRRGLVGEGPTATAHPQGSLRNQINKYNQYSCNGLPQAGEVYGSCGGNLILYWEKGTSYCEAANFQVRNRTRPQHRFCHACDWEGSTSKRFLQSRERAGSMSSRGRARGPRQPAPHLPREKTQQNFIFLYSCTRYKPWTYPHR